MLLLVTFCVAVFIQCYFFIFIFGKYNRAETSPKNAEVSGVSVVICAKNEADNLVYLLPQLANQQFPEFELILIDDASTDATLEVLKSFEKNQKNPNISIRIIQITKDKTSGKKAALTKGITAAKHNYILLTDADCMPLSDQWIMQMTNCFTEGVEVVLGYGGYEKIENSFLNKIIRFETLLTALQYFSYAMHGKAYMGVGRNLAYRKDSFEIAGGFTSHAHIRSGDDDLFVSQIASATNVNICDRKEAFTISKPHRNFENWINQKRRHITTANQYRFEIKSMLSLFYISQLSFYLIASSLLLLGIYPFISLILILIRFILWYAAISKTANKLNEKDLILFGPLYEISIIFIQLYIFVKNIIFPPKHW